MKCSKCGSENKNGRKYCWNCGELLAIICAVCGFENETNDLFCGGCGKKLGEEDKMPLDIKTQDSFSTGVKDSQMAQIDSGRIFSTDEKGSESDILKDKGSKIPVEGEEEDGEEEGGYPIQMSQDEIEKLFKENEEKDGKEEEVQEDKNIEIEIDESGSRYVDKNSSSRLDFPITQDELDELLREYKKKYGIE